MTQATQQNAIRLAAWVYAAHPQLFKKLLAKANAAKVATSKTANISGLGCNCGSGKVASLGAYRRRRFAGIGALGDDSSFSADVSLQPIDLSALDTGSTDTSSPDVSSALTDTSSSSGGFWSGLGSDLSSIGSDVLTGIGSVGSYLTSSSGLSSLTGLANTYFAGQAAQAQASTQQQVLQTQIQRTASGASPAPITYQRNAQGQLVPVYQSATGYTPLNSASLAALSTGSALPSWLPWAAVGGIGLIVLLKVL